MTDLPKEVMAVEFLEQSNAIEGVFDKNSLVQAICAWEFLQKQKNLTTRVILKTHKILMFHQPLRPDERGYFRTVPVWVGATYGMNHILIPSAIKNWLAVMNADYGKFTKDGVEEEIKDNHILYERIHPFVDGNGRTGRMFMNWQRLKLGLPLMVIYNDQKQGYYKWFEKGL